MDPSCASCGAAQPQSLHIPFIQQAYPLPHRAWLSSGGRVRCDGQTLARERVEDFVQR